MKYVSIDIETTGLDPEKHQILEFAAVIDDTSWWGDSDKQVNCLPSFRALVVSEDSNYNTNTYCALLHQRIFQEMEDNQQLIQALSRLDTPVFKSVEDGVTSIVCFPRALFSMFGNWLEKNGVETKPNGDIKIIPAGKNFYSFDFNFLKKLPMGRVRFNHRSLDPAAFFWKPGDSSIPSLTKCADQVGLEFNGDGLHSALADAQMVVSLLRQKMS